MKHGRELAIVGAAAAGAGALAWIFWPRRKMTADDPRMGAVQVPDVPTAHGIDLGLVDDDLLWQNLTAQQRAYITSIKNPSDGSHPTFAQGQIIRMAGITKDQLLRSIHARANPVTVGGVITDPVLRDALTKI